VVAIVAWLFLLMLDTKATVLGVSIDPSQLIPATLISLVAAGGPPIATKIKEALGK
jgi:hypothetical protein